MFFGYFIHQFQLDLQFLGGIIIGPGQSIGYFTEVHGQLPKDKKSVEKMLTFKIEYSVYSQYICKRITNI